MTQVHKKEIDLGPDANDVNAEALLAMHTALSYVPAQVSSEGTDKVSAHLKGIDAALFKAKSGHVLAGDFSGTPLKSDVTFTNPFPDNNFSVVISSQTDGRMWIIENQTASGFRINAQANQSLVGRVLWIARYEG